MAVHQSEIQQVVRDSAAKIGQLKETIEGRQATLNSMVALEKQNKKFECEKKQALEQMESLKSKVQRREERIAKEYREKFDTLKGDVEVQGGKFREKVALFEQTNGDLKNLLAAAESGGAAGLEDLILKHENEVNELVKTGNEKYQAMLLEQMGIQEALKVEMERLVKEARDAAILEMTETQEQVLGQLRASLHGEKEAALLALRRELDDKLEAQRAEFLVKIEKIVGDLKAKSDALSVVEKAKAFVITEHEKRLSDMQAQIGDGQVVYEKRLTALEAEILTSVQALDDERLKRKAAVAEREEQIARLDKALIDGSEKQGKLKTALAEEQHKVAKLEKMLDTLKQGSDAQSKQLAAELKSANAEVTRLKGDVSAERQRSLTLEGDITRVKGQADRDAAKAKVAAQEASANISDLTKGRADLQAQLKDAIAGATNASAASQGELDRLYTTLAEKEAQFKNDVAGAESKALAQIESLKQSHAAELGALVVQAKSAADKASARERDLTDAAAQAATEAQRKLLDQAKVAAVVLEERTAVFEQQVDGLKSDISDMEKQLQELSASADGEKGSLKESLTKMESKAKALQKELEVRRKDFERSESVCTGLKNQVEALREEIKASQKAFRDKMASSSALLESEWQTKYDKALLNAADEKDVAVEEARHALSGDLEEMRVAHEEALATLKRALQDEADSAAVEQERLEKERARLEQSLVDEKAARTREVGDLQSRTGLEYQELEARLKSELEETNRRLTREKEERERELVGAHTTAQEATKAELNAVIDESAARAAADKAAALEAAARQRQLEEAELRTQLEQDRQASLAALRAEMEAAADVLRREHKIVLDELHQQLGTTKLSLVDSRAESTKLEGGLAEEKKAREWDAGQTGQRLEMIGREHDSAIRREREAQERSAIEAAETMAMEVKMLKDDFQEERDELEEQKREILADLQALEEKYLNRDSRPEDLVRIAELETEMVDKDALVAKTREEMLYFKREMLNREDNYNSKFSAAPNVGVMQVIKPKDDKKSQKGRKSMNSANPAVSNSAPSSSMGIGGMGAGLGGGGGVSGRRR